MNSPLERLDHIAIVVKDTTEALRFYRDQLGLKVLFSEELKDAPVRLTHLDTRTPVHLQLVQPLSDDHPLAGWLRTHGEGLHHVCFKVRDVAEAMKDLPAFGLTLRDAQPRSGPNGRAAAFLNSETTRGVQLEITSDPAAAG